MKILSLIFCLTVCLHCTIMARAVPHPDSILVLQTVQGFFDAMEKQDTLAARSLLTPEGQNYSVYDSPVGPVVKTFSNSAFISQLTDAKRIKLERMWDATVLLEDRIAVVWTPYDFHINGIFSHCGVDAFTLVKTLEGWKISSIAYTKKSKDCPESPLGPPQAVRH